MTINQLAKTSLAVARSLGLQPEQESKFATLIMTECLFGNSPLDQPGGYEEEPEPPEPAPTVPIETEPVKTTKKRIRKMKEAAAKVDPVRKLLCRANTKCICSVCAKPLYTVLSDIYDGLKAEDFAAKFLPIGHTKTIPIPTRLRAIDGCVMTDCPVCDGDMSLVLWGKKPERDFEDGSVGSTGRVE
jgi:hypothetical protein